MENEGGHKEVAAGVPEGAGEAAFGAVEMETLRGSGDPERQETPVMPAAETAPVILPPTIPMVSSNIDDAGSQDGDAPVVGRDAERMPKEYAKHLVEIMRRYKKEPNKLQRSVTNLKWDYMGKAFSRKLGDGLDGKAKN
ncbi:hypothetical protein FWF89_02670 [Candidatus Saccharibacteria bacterium]|nr:hypothetical protein [Candidatus Saccharibacteria bacterium]